MASQSVLSVPQGNDVTVDLYVLEDNRITPQDLTGLTPQMIIKGYASAPDSGATVLGVSTGLTIVSLATGTLTAFLPRTLLALPGSLWWRLDLLDGSGDHTTAIYGQITIRAV